MIAQLAVLLIRVSAKEKLQHFLLLIFAGLIMLWAEAASAIQITEIMYNPAEGGSSREFVELYNETAARRDIGGWKFINGMDFTFPEGTIIEPGSFLIVAGDPESLKGSYKIDVPVFGPFKGALNDEQGRLTLIDLAGGYMADVEYKNSGRWPIAPGGTGNSLSKIRPRLDPNQPESWQSSLSIGGTPGRDNGLDGMAQDSRPVMVNEISVLADQGFMEIYSRLPEPFDLSGYWVSSLPGKLKSYKIPDGTILPPHGYRHFPLKELNLEADQESSRVFITTPDGTQVVEACAFGGIKEQPGMSRGRYPDGSDEWYVMTPSPGKSNAVNINTDVVINEIMYHPPSESDEDEYIELYNRGKLPVNLTGWSFTSGVSFTFPQGTIIAPDSYLVAAGARAHLISRYSLEPDLVFGDYSGRLSNEGETVRLCDSLGNKVDEVHYYDDGHWSKDADGYGSSLELIDPYQDNNNYQAWKASNEERKSEWTHISYSGVCRESWRGGYEFHCHLLGAGEMLIDDIHLTASRTPSSRSQGEEMIANGSFENGTAGWSALGNHIRSYVLRTSSPHGQKCLKLVASGSGNPGPNHIEAQLRTSLRRNETYTLSFWVKWQRGCNLLVTRCLGNQIPETHHIPIPEKTGSPGRRNSVYLPNLGPVFSDVRHSPVIPLPADTVHVTAGIYDPDGVGSVTLYYKPDSVPSYQPTEMYDDGKHNDGAANDGVYGGSIPPYQSRQTVAFCIKAKDGKERPNTWPRDLENPGLYRIEERTMRSNLPTYRIIMTAKDERELSRRISLSNEPLNATFIFDERDIYYQVTCRYTGSPFRRGRGNFSGYKILFNADEKLHGVKWQARFDRNDNAPEGFYNERISYDLLRKMGVPTCEQEWIRVRFNSTGSNIVWEDILPPSKRYLSIFYPDDSDGYLYELSEQFTFFGRPGEEGNFDARGANFEWFGTDDKDLYRWNYLPRSNEREDDFSRVIKLIKVLNSPGEENYEAAVAEVVNVSSWLKMMAVRAVVSDWDFIGTGPGKNAYIYYPNKTGKWDLLSWDNEWGFEQTQMPIWSGVGVIRRLQESPGYKHLYLSYIQELMDKYFREDYLQPWFEHYHSVVRGVSPQQMSEFVRWRREYLSYIIPKAEARITGWEQARTGIKLRGSAPIQTRRARVNGKEQELKWTDEINWELTVPEAGKGRLTIEFLDYDMKVIGQSVH